MEQAFDPSRGQRGETELHGTLDRWSRMSPVDFKKKQCRMSLNLFSPMVTC